MNDTSRVPEFFQAAHELSERITAGDVTLDHLKGSFMDPDVPAQPVCVQEYLAWLGREVLPYTVNVSSKKFVGHMTSALPDFLPEVSALVAALNQNMVKVETSKSFTLLERQLVAMLHKELFGGAEHHDRIQDPHHVFGLVVSGGSSANITALWNARNRALLELGFTKSEIVGCGAFELLRQRGYDGFAIITSSLAHYSIRKAASLLGIGERDVLFLKQDARSKVDIGDLEIKLELCRRKRLLPIAIVGIAGATETGTIDPLVEMGEIASRHHVHFHVDAAWGGALIFSDKYRGMLEGIERADTITLCPHKQLYTPQGISLCLFKDSTAVHASSVQAAYQGREGSFDSGQYTLEGSRSAIFLCLHAMLCVLSKRGIAELVEQGIEKTRRLAEAIAAHPAFQVIGTPEINILNYRYLPRSVRHKSSHSPEENRLISAAVTKIQERQFLEGRTFVSRTEMLSERHCTHKITVFRVVIANPLTTHEDLLETLADQLEIAGKHVERANEGTPHGGRPALTPQVRDALRIEWPEIDEISEMRS
ncbi:MAG TPA: aminotransferase class V-fold PLP-dependent enzyme [Steroidobacteraceae bacterium]